MYFYKNGKRWLSLVEALRDGTGTITFSPSPDMAHYPSCMSAQDGNQRWEWWMYAR